ncbi:hypothetical protein KCP69_03285 [Salmonella enterica subsp. enterica]|nr:hypothetical protein KCP69_03285 [Salmonella enterica subsp. enterica]
MPNATFRQTSRDTALRSYASFAPRAANPQTAQCRLAFNQRLLQGEARFGNAFNEPRFTTRTVPPTTHKALRDTPERKRATVPGWQSSRFDTFRQRGADYAPADSLVPKHQQLPPLPRPAPVGLKVFCGAA